MNAIHIELANLSAGPLDGQTIPVHPDQDMFHAILGDREHTYLRIGDTRNFVHVSIRRLFPASDGLEVAGLSMFQDDPPRAGLLKSVLSIAWIHRLRSKMG